MVLYFSMLMPVNLDARACLKKAFRKVGRADCRNDFSNTL